MKLISALLSTALAGAGTDYSVQGKNWAGTCETGQRQSPIAIEGTTTVKEFSVNPFVLNNYSRDNEFDVTLDHSIKMTPTATDITWVDSYQINFLKSRFLDSTEDTSITNILWLNSIFTGAMLSVVVPNTHSMAEDTFPKSTWFITKQNMAV